MSQLAPNPKAPETLVQDLRQLIIDARRHAASVVNSTLTLLYWRVGDRIRRDVLQNERARYGQQILATLSQELIAEFGRGFDATNLTRMMKFVESFPDEEIVATLSQQLSWSMRPDPPLFPQSLGSANLLLVHPKMMCDFVP
jgi:DUF1016 N-terminal domain